MQLRFHIEVETIEQADSIVKRMIDYGLVNTETDLAGIAGGSTWVKKYLPKPSEPKKRHCWLCSGSGKDPHFSLNICPECRGTGEFHP